MFVNPPWFLVAAVGRGFFRAVKAFPPLFLIIVGAGLSLGVFFIYFATDPVPANVVLLRALGLGCLLFYGSLLWLFIARQCAGKWGATCDYGYQIFTHRTNPLRAQQPPVTGEVQEQADIETGISIKRAVEFFALARGLPVFVDGQEVGQVPFCARRLFALTPGTHEVFVQMDWCRSEPVSLTLKQGDLIELRCGCRYRFVFPLNMVGAVAWPNRFFFLRPVVQNLVGSCRTNR